jgi:hypothetical protein
MASGVVVDIRLRLLLWYKKDRRTGRTKMTNEEMTQAMDELRASVAGSQADRELQERRDREVIYTDWTQDPRIGRN